MDGARDDEVVSKIKDSLTVRKEFWSDEACRVIEAYIEELAVLARAGKFRAKTVDRTPLRSKYFFGYGYTYGSQISKKGGEQILPPELIDPVPDFIYDKLILPLEERGVVPEGWINSAVVNDYRRGGMIVSHIDPPQLFARPIFLTSFFAEGRLVFGSRFSFPNKGGPPETTRPKHVCPISRGSLAIMEGFSANGITHGIRPQDMDGRRVSITLRHVFPNAPRLGQPLNPAITTYSDSLLGPPSFECTNEEPERATVPDEGPDRDKVSVSVEPIEEIDEYGRRRETSNRGEVGGVAMQPTESSVTSSPKAKTMAEKQKAALLRLQQRHARRNRSRSPRR